MAQSILYRPMQPGEETAVCELVARTFAANIAPLYAAQGRREFLGYASPDAMARRSRLNHFVILAVTAEKPIGMIEIRRNTHVSMLFVDPDHQRQGIGRELLLRALEIIRERQPGLVQITVNSSPNSVTAYEQFGFKAQEPLQVTNGIAYIPMAMELEL